MDDTTTPIVINAFPTPKEQIVNYALGLALTGTTLIVGFGTLYVAGRILEARETRIAKKNANIHVIKE
jgi:transketolase C-terminal domain/subunit